MPDEKHNYYLEQLKQQVSFLIDACEKYDKGIFYQAKNMSAIIRTLVKDPENTNPKRRNQTVSLLKSLDIKDTMKFYNTGYEAIDPKMSINLVGIATVPANAPLTTMFEHLYLPLLNNSDLIDCRWLNFSDWWNSKVIVSKSESREIIFTRKKICLTMAEQDGGVHVDSYENIDKDYRDIANYITHVFVNVDSNGKESPIMHLQYALVRQIAHELILSIKKVFSLNLDYNPTNKYNLRGIPENKIKQFGVFAEDGMHLSSRTKYPFRCTGFSSFKTPDNAAYVKIQF